MAVASSPTAVKPVEVEAAAAPAEVKPAVDTTPEHTIAVIPGPGPIHDLRYVLEVGQQWDEAVEVVMHAQRSDEPPVAEPTLHVQSTEHFEVVAKQSDAVHLQITTTWLRKAPRDGSAVESGKPLPADVAPFLLQELAWVGVAKTFRIDATGRTLELLHEQRAVLAAQQYWTKLQAEAGIKANPDDAAAWQADVDRSLTANREWGVRPLFPADGVAVGGGWTETLQTSSLFDAKMDWSIEYQFAGGGAEGWQINRKGRATMLGSPRSALHLNSVEVSLTGELWVDHQTGALQRSETAVTAVVEAGPSQGEKAGTKLTMAHTTKRRRQAGDGGAGLPERIQRGDGGAGLPERIQRGQ